MSPKLPAGQAAPPRSSTERLPSPTSSPRWSRRRPSSTPPTARSPRAPTSRSPTRSGSRSDAAGRIGLSGEEIRRRLEALAARWSVYEGSERAGAQTFLTDLFACYGQELPQVARFEEPQAGRFVDLIWPRVCLFEMKAPSEAGRLARHRPQALDYWRDAADPERGIEAPRFVVLCAFRKLEIWEPGRF